MKSFIIRTLFFGLLVILIDRGLFLFIEYNRPADYRAFIDSKKTFFEKSDVYDLLIIGDSHIADAINTRLIEKDLGLKAFNLGIYNASPFENYFVVKDALKHLKEKPNIVLLGTNHIMFQRPLSKGAYTPLIIKNDFALTRDSEKGFDKTYFLKSIQEEYVLKGILKNKLFNKKYKPTREITSVYNGHLAFNNQIKDVDWQVDIEHKNENNVVPEQIEYFRQTINFLKQEGVRVIIVNTPVWVNLLNKLTVSGEFKEFDQTIQAIAHDFDLEIINPDYFEMQNVLVQEDFLDLQHLNIKGASKFTLYVCDHLKTK